MSTLRWRVLLLVAFAGVLGIPDEAWACTCLGTISKALSFRNAPVAFVGKVESVQARPPLIQTILVDGKPVTGATPTASDVRFTISEPFKGTTGSEITVPRSDICPYPFIVGESYLVYASPNGAELFVNPCETLRIAVAGEPLKYLQGLKAGRPQTLLYGLITVRTADRPWEFTVHAEGGGATFEVPLTSGGYEIVLPPGEYRVWLTQGRNVIGKTESFRLAAGDERSTPLGQP